MNNNQDRDKKNYPQRSSRPDSNKPRPHNSGGFNKGPNPPLTKRPAAYTFAPVTNQVVFPEWSAKVSHDLPFKEGISCSLQLTITAETPMLIGGNRSESKTMSSTVNFYQQPDGNYAIPGSSLRGAIRSVLEIVTFSRMQLIDDKWLSWRDLQNNQYTNQMTNKSQAGWLKFDGKQWLFCKTEYEKDEFSTLGNGMNWQERSSAKKRIEAFMSKGNQLKDGDYYRVFTGNTGVKGDKGKKHEFAFIQPEKPWTAINDDVIKAFIQIHAESDDLVNLKELVKKGHYPAIPVFALLDKNSSPTAIGLASMFRLSYKNSIGKLRPKAHSQELDKLDFAETIFGKTDAEKGNTSLKSRIQFLPCVITSNLQPMAGIDVVLNSPKPSFYPYYLKQTQGEKLGTVPFKQDGSRPKPSYKTYDNGELSGYKRYPVRNKATPLQATAEQKKIGSTLKPLPAGAVFKGKVNIHNLTPIELGAVIWALTWGDKSNLRHSLGMGKSYGYGQAKISIENIDELLLQNDGKTTTLKDCLNKFEAYMSQCVTDWKTSPTISNLLAQANPELASKLSEVFPLSHPKLSGDNGNEFVAIKKAGGYLPAYTEITKK